MGQHWEIITDIIDCKPIHEPLKDIAQNDAASLLISSRDNHVEEENHQIMKHVNVENLKRMILFSVKTVENNFCADFPTAPIGYNCLE